VPMQLHELSAFFQAPIYLIPEKEASLSFKETLELEEEKPYLAIFATEIDSKTTNAANKQVFERMWQALNKQQGTQLQTTSFNHWFAERFTPNRFTHDLAATSIKVVLIFGVSMERFGWSTTLPPYEIVQEENIQYLWVDSLATIEQDVTKKKQLWEQLLKLFPSSKTDDH
ncbi:MAG: hypothetical protein AAF734_08745, partial [Bacteroidota bacterium]